jgi:hypothetical protein
MKMGRGVAVPDPRMEGFLELLWHGAHDGGSGEHPDVLVRMPIAEDVDGGQCELYVCSTQCLRRFFTGLVDELERRIRAKSKRERARRARAAR